MALKTKSSFCNQLTEDSFEGIVKRLEDGMKNSKPNLIFSRERELSWEDFSRLVKIVVAKGEKQQQRCTELAHTLGKDLYLFFTEASGKPVTYWFDIISNPVTREWDLKLRGEISDFIKKFFKTNPSAALRDISKQKRKNKKQKDERDLQSHRCDTCKRAFKNQRQKEVHLKKCRPHSCNSKPAVNSLKLLTVAGGRNLRRSGRVPNAEKQQSIFMKKWSQSYEKGLQVRAIKDKGYGVTANRVFKKGDFICEYKGELLRGKDNISDRHRKYNEMGSEVGSFMYEFTFKGKKDFCIDGTMSSGIGRLINHSAKRANVRPTIWDFEGPKLLFVANRRIERCEEILYNYDDRDKDTVASNSWLKL